MVKQKRVPDYETNISTSINMSFYARTTIYGLEMSASGLSDDTASEMIVHLSSVISYLCHALLIALTSGSKGLRIWKAELGWRKEKDLSRRANGVVTYILRTRSKAKWQELNIFRVQTLPGFVL